MKRWNKNCHSLPPPWRALRIPFLSHNNVLPHLVVLVFVRELENGFPFESWKWGSHGDPHPTSGIPHPTSHIPHPASHNQNLLPNHGRRHSSYFTFHILHPTWVTSPANNPAPKSHPKESPERSLPLPPGICTPNTPPAGAAPYPALCGHRPCAQAQVHACPAGPSRIPQAAIPGGGAWAARPWPGTHVRWCCCGGGWNRWLQDR